MTELGAIFAELGISQYHDIFVEQGFDTWDTILDITESDFDALGVKLGHRRKLQRRIANSKSQAEQSRAADEHADERARDGRDGGINIQTGKRKYRRHPKPDENAPERPPSAYVIFSNKMREDLKGRHLSFTEIAKLVGEHWQNLSPDDKEPYEAKALAAKEKFNNEMAAYKKTDSYRDYAHYLAEFKAKQASQQQSKLPQPPHHADASKRPKLEPHHSSTSNSTSGSGSDSRKDSRAPATSTFALPTTSPTGPAGRTALPSMPPVVTGSLHASPGPMSSGATSMASPPPPGAGVYPTATPTPLAWREPPREDPQSQQLPSINNLAELGSMPGAHRRRQSFVPSLASETTAGSVSSFAPSLSSEKSSSTSSVGSAKLPPLPSDSSGASNGSTPVFPHRTLEPSMERPLAPTHAPAHQPRAIPPIYAAKPMSMYDGQLPPLLPPPISPPGLVAHPSPTDYSGPLQPLRAYALSSKPPFASASDGDPPPGLTNVMDPFSALLKAGEIVDRNSKGPSTTGV